MKKVLTVLLLMIGTFSAAMASEEVSLTALVNNATLTFNTGELPANSVITSATLNLTGRDTSSGVELFEIRVLANGQIAGHLSSDDWFNDAENSIWLDASNLNIVNSQIQLQIASSLEGSGILPSTASLLVNYEQGSSTKAKTTRVDNTKTPVPDSGYDANPARNPMSYVKLDDNGVVLSDAATSWTMVRDNVTGLIWEMKTDDSTVHDKDNKYTWYDSNAATNGGNAGTAGTGTDTEDFIKALNDSKYGGYSDWRMPTVEELAGIVDYGVHNPAINKKYFVNTQNSQYWTGTTYSGNIARAWYVRFDDGIYSYNDKSTAYYARAVRGGATAASALVENGDGTVTDPATGLMWQQTNGGNMTFNAARAYCDILELGGYTDWRLPTIKELQTIVDYGIPYHSPVINTTIFFDTFKQYYWSSSWNKYSGYLSLIQFEEGYYNWDPPDYSHYFRAVRGGHAGLFDNLTISVSPVNGYVGKDAGTTTFEVKNAGTGSMTWTAAVIDGGTWLKITSGSSGTNAGTITCSVTANTSISTARVGTIRITAVNGTAGSPKDVTLTQQPVIKPSGDTYPADTITTTSATLNGYVHPQGTATTWYFQYGPTTSYGYNTTNTSAGSGTTYSMIKFDLTGLAASTTYHYRLVATNNAGTINGVDQAFTTLGTTALSPTVTTTAATSITKTSATLNGAVIPNGTATTYYFLYGTTTSYGSNTATVDAGSGTTSKSVSANIDGLAADTRYYYRLVAKNSNGTVYGTALFFVTTPPVAVSLPKVTTGTAGSITATTATINGTVNPNGGQTTCYYEYGKTTTYGNVTPTADAGQGTTDKNVPANLTGLAAKTLYHYRLIATNSAGKTTGTDKTFTTLDTPPVGTAPKLTLSSASGASGTAVTLNLLFSNVTGTNISAVSTDIDFDTALLDTPTAVIGASATAAGKETITVDMVDSNTVRIAVFSMSNSKAIGDGVVASITFAIKPTATNGASVTLTQSAVGSDSNGNDIAMTGVEGKISVNNCKLGDCNCDGTVTIGEVQSAVNMYLGTKTVAPCCDRDGNGAVSIAEVQAVINNFRGIEKSADNRSDSDGIADTRNDSDRIATATTPTLTLEGKSATAGETIKLALTLSTNGAEITSVSTDIAYDVNLFSSATAEIGAAGTDAGKIIIQSDLGGKIRVGIYSINNSNLIGDGVVAYINLTAKSTATGTASIKNTASGADQDAKDIVITGNTAQVSFSGSGTGTKPTVVISQATLITANSAKLAGTVKPNGKATTYYFEFGATTTYGQKTASFDAGSGTLAAAVSADLLGLNAGTTYHFRLVATNSAGTTTSADKTFITTSVLKPVVTTELATLVTATTARLNGTVNPNGLATSYYFQYGTTTSYGSTTRSLRSGSERASFSVNKSITGLAKATIYHFRIVAINSAGTTYGLDKTFTTLQ